MVEKIDFLISVPFGFELMLIKNNFVFCVILITDSLFFTKFNKKILTNQQK